MYILSADINFPLLETADENGFLAIGGDLSPDRLLTAYRSGIFPWYNEDDPVCWWSPDPRCVLFPSRLHISKSMKQVLKQNKFVFKVNTAFKEVMKNCRDTVRKGESGSWIHEDMITAYCRLFEMGYAFSGESWYNGKLVGGLYGVRIGKVLFGESMFSLMPDASKFAFIRAVEYMMQDGLELIDCQLRTDHLVSLGAEMITRNQFIELVNKFVEQEGKPPRESIIK